jgi:hypothetical protein
VTSGSDEHGPQPDEPEPEPDDDGEEEEQPREDVPPDYLDPKPMDVTGR